MESRRRTIAVPWTRRSTLKLISLLKLYPVLWLPEHRDYLKYNVREQAYKDIALELHKTKLAVTIEEIRKKIHTLRSQYMSQVNSILEEQRRFGVARQPSLWSFDELGFLWSICARGVDMPNFLERGTERKEMLADNILEGDDSDQSDFEEFYEDITDGNTACIVTIEPVNLFQANVEKNIPFRSKKIYWNRKHTKKLIECYRHNELLWNPTHHSYDDQKLRDEATEKIARHLAPLLPGITSMHIKAKLHTIRSQYRKQLRNIELLKGTNIPQRAPLWCFKLLSFLWPICKSGEYPMSMISANDTDDNDESNIDTDDSIGTANTKKEDHDILLTNVQNESSDIDCSDIELCDVDDDSTLSATLEIKKPSANCSVLKAKTNTATACSSAQTKLPNQNGSNFKCRFNWLGEYAVSSINKLKSEDVIYDTVNTIENLLGIIRTMDTKASQCQSPKRYKDDIELRPPQRHFNHTRPKLSHFNSFDVSFDLSRLCINNINVKVINQSIVIEGVYEAMSNEDQVPKRFLRHYELPNGYDFRSVSATISADGILRVTAHKLIGSSNGEREIQIKRVGSSNLYRNFGSTGRKKTIL